MMGRKFLSIQSSKFGKNNKQSNRILIMRISTIMLFLFLLLIVVNSASAEPFLDGHFIVVIQGDDPDTDEVEPGSQLIAIERYDFQIPWNETWVEVPVPKIAKMEGMRLNQVVSVDSMGYIPGVYSEYWNQNNPPFKLFKDMTGMACCIADSYTWGFPENADRNTTKYIKVDSDTDFDKYFDDMISDDIWNFSILGLSMKPGYEYGNYISIPTILEINITKLEMSWEVAAFEENVSFFVSNNNGTNWLNMTDREGEEVIFTTSGNELIWKIIMSQDIAGNNTPVLNDLWINTTYTPFYTEITLQLEYAIGRDSNKFEIVWDLNMDYGDGVTPHTLIYTDKDHKLKSEGIPLSLYEAQTEYPTKDAYTYMSLDSGSYSPEASVIITKMVDEEIQFPWILILILFIIVLIVLVLLFSRPKTHDEAKVTQTEEAGLSEDQQLEHDGLKHKKEGLLKAINKLDSDFEEGLLDEDVYSDLKGNYKQKTIDVMKQMDVLAAAAPVVPIGQQSSPEKEALKEKKEKILMGIKKLDSDYEEGLLDEEIYQELREDYKKKAVDIMKEIEEN